MKDINTTTGEINEFNQSLLYVHQEKWQKGLLMKYRNIISLMDVTHKTIKYKLQLFLSYVGYSIVAEFIIQFKTASHIEEALSILTKWNLTWCPLHFMCD